MDDLGVAVVIEDDADVRNLLEGVLSQAGFEVHTAVDGRAGVEVVRSKQANVVTLDIGLPDIDGFEVLRRIRGFSNAYVVMLTGRPRHEVNGPGPVLATWDAPPAAAPRPDEQSVLQHNGLMLNHRTRTVEIKGEPLGLTRSEFDLLHVLLRGGGAVCTRSDLVRAVRGDFYDEDTYISEADERAVEVHIGNLRRKLKEDQLSPRWLQTVRGVGYRLAPARPHDM